MGFWIFMLIMDLLLPFTMIGFGRYFMKKAPKEINSVFGYRTSMSMKNKDTWEFAHKYCGKVWYVCGMVMLPITVIFMLLVIGKNEEYVTCPRCEKEVYKDAITCPFCNFGIMAWLEGEINENGESVKKSSKQKFY